MTDMTFKRDEAPKSHARRDLSNPLGLVDRLINACHLAREAERRVITIDDLDRSGL